MADTTTLKQTAATDTAPGHTPAGADRTPTVHKPGGSPTSRELDLEALLGDELGAETIEQPDPELDRDLPKGKKAKKSKQAPETPNAKAKAAKPDAEEADETDTLNSAVEPESEEEGEEDEAEEEGDDDEDTEEGEEETEEEDDSALDADVDPSKPPKGYEKVPKGIWKRHNDLRSKNRDLRDQVAAGAVRLMPTSESPLNDVTDIAALDERVAEARRDRDWLEENPQGGPRKVNGKEVEVSEEEAAKLRKKSKLIIDSDATVRARLNYRAERQPWKVAQAITPAMFEQGQPEHSFMLGVLGQVPEIVQNHPEWETLLAYAAKGARIVHEESTKKARYVRFELDANGKPIPLSKQKTVIGSGTAKPKPKAPPANPGSERPALTRRNDAPRKPLVTTTGDSDSGLSAMLSEELGE